MHVDTTDEMMEQSQRIRQAIRELDVTIELQEIPRGRTRERKFIRSEADEFIEKLKLYGVELVYEQFKYFNPYSYRKYLHKLASEKAQELTGEYRTEYEAAAEKAVRFVFDFRKYHEHPWIVSYSFVDGDNVHRTSVSSSWFWQISRNETELRELHESLTAAQGGSNAS